MSVKIEISIEEIDNGWTYKIGGWSPGYASTLNGVFIDLAALAPHEARKQARAS